MKSKSLFSRQIDYRGHGAVACPSCDNHDLLWHLVFPNGPSLSDVIECKACCTFVTWGDMVGASSWMDGQ